MTPEQIHELLSKIRFDLSTEQSVQKGIRAVLPNAVPEYRFDAKNRVDFFLDGIAIEVKIKGVAKSIYKQCERYCGFESVKALILITNRSMGFPQELCGKPCYVVNLGRSWL